MKILILANHYNTLRVFRKELLIKLAQNNDVVVSLPPTDAVNLSIIESYGCRVVIEPEMDRRGNNPFRDIALLNNYIKLMKFEKPDKVITYTIKPNIYGAQACKKLKIPCFCNVTGLGSAFENGGLTKKIVTVMYRFSINKADKIFFENIGNRDTFIKAGIIKEEKTIVMPGAGVNTEEFYETAYPDDKNGLNFIFVGRIMKEKGVDELFYAIEKLHSVGYKDLNFEFIGWYEDSYEEKVRELQDKGLINFDGFQPNVKPFIEKSHCVILPSWHEGMSNTLLEGASMCKPLITSNIHGCMEAIENNMTGILFDVKDKFSLFDTIKEFIELPYEKKEQMGILGRQRMKENFDKNMVVDKTINEIGIE